jgi:glutathione S-transferase
MPAVELFGLERSIYTRIARLALEEKGVAYTLHEVEIFGPSGVPEAHRLRHPFGRIPVLRHGDFELYETAAITRYVDEAFDGPALQPSEPAQRARMNQLIGLLDAYAYQPMVWGVFVQRVRRPLQGEAADEAKIAQSIEQSRTCLQAVIRLAAFEPFLVSRSISLADLHAAPMLRYLSLAPEGKALLDQHHALTTWLQSMLARPSLLRTATRYEVAA